MAKGNAKLIFFKTNSGAGAKVTIPRDIVKELNIKGQEVFSQEVLGRYIKMKKVIDLNKNIPSVSVNQFETSTSIQTTVYILPGVIDKLKLKNKDVMLFETTQQGEIIIKRF